MSSIKSSVSLAMLPSEETIKAQAELAFTDTVTADTKRSTAEQRMAYVVQCTISNLHASGSKELKLDFAFTNKEHKATIFKRMVAAYAGSAPTSKDVTPAAYAKANETYRIRSNLVKRGAWIAIVLASRGVVYTNFEVKAGVYTVPADCLLPKDCTPLGYLAKTARIPLNRTPIAYLSKSQSVASTQASVKHMLDCVVPSEPKGTDKKKQEPGKETATEKQVMFGKATATELATGSSLTVLIAAVHQLFVKDSGPSLMRLCDMPQSWNLLTDITMKFDECKAGPDWTTRRDTKDADERIAPATKGKPGKAKAA